MISVSTLNIFNAVFAFSTAVLIFRALNHMNKQTDFALKLSFALVADMAAQRGCAALRRADGGIPGDAADQRGSISPRGVALAALGRHKRVRVRCVPGGHRVRAEAIASLRSDLIRDEGVAKRRPGYAGRLFPYRDGKGIQTIGIGRNLDQRGISDAEALQLLDNDIAEHLALLDRELPWWKDMDGVRQIAFANLAFNLGVGPTSEQPDGKLLTFHETLAAFKARDYQTAANHLSVTLWAQQVGERATRLISVFRSG
jgi:lysozyme